MTSIEWYYFRATVLWTFLICALLVGIVEGCSVEAQPTACDRQLANARAEIATLRATLGQCQKK